MRRRTHLKTQINKKTAGATRHMVRSSGEQPRDVKRRSARRGGSIPPHAEQQEKSIFCPPLETVQPTRKEDTGQANSHWRLGKTSKKSIIIGSKGLGNAHFFLAAGKTANKRRFTNGLPSG